MYMFLYRMQKPQSGSQADLLDPSTKNPLLSTQRRKKQKKSREVIRNMKTLALSSPNNISNISPGLFILFAATIMVLLTKRK